MMLGSPALCLLRGSPIGAGALSTVNPTSRYTTAAERVLSNGKSCAEADDKPMRSRFFLPAIVLP